MKRKFDLEKTVYAVAAIAFFFLLWWFLTTFTPVKETTPGPIEVLQPSPRSGRLLGRYHHRHRAGHRHGHLPLGGSHLQAHF